MGPGGPVYVKKWMRTKHAIMFRLSNKVVQVNFQDHTEVLLNSESRQVTYVNKKGERSTMPLNLAMDSTNQEMTKRLKYTKDILTHMLNANPGAVSKAPGSSTNVNAGGTGGVSSNRMGTITSAVSSKRSGMSTQEMMGMSNGMSIRGGGGSTQNVGNYVSASDRKPLNVLNQAS